MEVTDLSLQIAFIHLRTAWDLEIDHMCCMDYVILIRVVSNSAAVLFDGSIKSLFSGVVIQFCKSLISREENLKYNSFFIEIEKVSIGRYKFKSESKKQQYPWGLRLPGIFPPILNFYISRMSIFHLKTKSFLFEREIIISCPATVLLIFYISWWHFCVSWCML